MNQALATAPMRYKKHQHRLQPRRLSPGFKATASSCGNSQTAHATHSTPSPPHSRQDHETPTSPQTPDNKLHHRHAKVFKPPLRQTPPIVDQHSAGYSSSNPTLKRRTCAGTTSKSRPALPTRTCPKRRETGRCDVVFYTDPPPGRSTIMIDWSRPFELPSQDEDDEF